MIDPYGLMPSSAPSDDDGGVWPPRAGSVRPGRQINQSILDGSTYTPRPWASSFPSLDGGSFPAAARSGPRSTPWPVAPSPLAPQAYGDDTDRGSGPTGVQFASAPSPSEDRTSAAPPSGQGQATPLHDADPPAPGLTFPRNPSGPVVPEPQDRDPRTGMLNLDRLSGRIADRMVYGSTGMLPASYMTTGQGSQELSPVYVNLSSGQQVSGD